MKNKKNIIDGYYFADSELFKEAQNELEGVEYLRKRTDFSNPQSVLQIYHTVIEKKLFKTPIGYEFLRELQNVLNNSKDIDMEQVYPIPVFVQGKQKTQSAQRMQKLTKVVEKTSPYRIRYINMILVNIVLVILLIIFIAISNNSKNLNIINYRNRLEAEYREKEDALAKWAVELQEKEDALEK